MSTYTEDDNAPPGTVYLPQFEPPGRRSCPGIIRPGL